MIEARPYTPDQIRVAYDRRAAAYTRIVVPLEWPNHEVALDAAAVKPGETVLEVAFGPGRTLVELARRVGASGRVHGVDFTPGMHEQARLALARAGVPNVELHQGDARALPLPDAAFDLVYNAYMLDLIPLPDMPGILAEFGRVLRPGGRMVLLNMSKPDASQVTWRERLYRSLPASLVLNLGGGCRPVLMEPLVREAGFTSVTRRFLAGRFPSEVVVGHKAQGASPEAA